MGPLNTEAGQGWLWRAIAAVGDLDAILFDSVAFLTTGDKTTEDSWAPIQPLTLKLSARGIGQVWLNHTGHNTDHGYGSKTKEWGMTAVLALKNNAKGTEAAQGASVHLKFDKARERNKATWRQFDERAIAYDGGSGWAVTGASPSRVTVGGRKSEREIIKTEMLAAVARLCVGRLSAKIAVEVLRDELKATGFLEMNDAGGLSTTGRSHFNRAKTDLLSDDVLVERDGVIWKRK